MRRPGFLGGTHYWFGTATMPSYPRKQLGGIVFRLFGDSCVVCTDGKCTNVCTREEQLARVRTKHRGMRERAEATRRFEITSSTDEKAFAMVPGENRNTRLKRLEKAGLYVPGAIMSIDYGNLVNFGTTDKQKVAEMKRKLIAEQQQKNILRYGTSDIKKIVEIEKGKKTGREEMWKRLYGTSDPDQVYRIPANVRRAKCEADEECSRIERAAHLFKKRD